MAGANVREALQGIKESFQRLETLAGEPLAVLLGDKAAERNGLAPGKPMDEVTRTLEARLKEVQEELREAQAKELIW